MKESISRLFEIIACDRAGRGVSKLNRISFWENSVRMLQQSKRIAVITGFMVPDTHSPETDGPPGSVILGRALIKSGRVCNIFTDPLCHEAVAACSLAVQGPPVRCVSDSLEITEWSPDLVIFIERLGRAVDGCYYNMRCTDISEYTFPLDEMLFLHNRQFTTLAIGDGGNEAGMGTLKEEIGQLIPEFADCASVTEADIVLPVDVSNWGAYALATLFSIYESRWLGHSLEEEQRMLSSLVRCGAVDGVTRFPTLSVDGFSIEYEKEIIFSLRQIYVNSVHG